MSASGASSSGARKSSFREMYLVNKSTYYALLQKLTPLEKTDIERMNRQTLLPDDDDQMGFKSKPATSSESASGSSASSNSTATTSAATTNVSSDTASPAAVPLATNNAADVFEEDQQQQEVEEEENSPEPTAVDNHDSAAEHTTDTPFLPNNIEEEEERRGGQDAVAADNGPKSSTVDTVQEGSLAPPTTSTTTVVEKQPQGPSLPEFSKGKGHQMPHRPIVTLKSVPQTLVTQIHGPTVNSKTSSSAPSTSTEPISKPKVKSADSNKKKMLYKCKLCEAEFKVEWALFKHVTTKHDNSEYAKEAIIARENTLQANRARLRSSQKIDKNKTQSVQQAKAMEEAKKDGTGEKNVASSSASTSATAVSNQKSDKPKSTRGRSKQVSENTKPTPKSSSSSSSKSTKAKRATKTSTEPYPKSKPGSKSANKSKNLSKSSKGNQDSVVAMDHGPPSLVRTATMAGRKRPNSSTVKVGQKSAPKRTSSGTLAVSAPVTSTGAKRQKSMFTTNKRSRYADSDDDDDNDGLHDESLHRPSKGRRRLDDDSSDDEYQTWKY